MFSVHNFISISDLRSNLSQWLDKAQTEPVLILQNSKPKAALVDPEYLEYLEQYANGVYDKGDMAEIQRAILQKESEDVVPFNLEDYAN